MTINDKEAIPLRLHCPNKEVGCPGEIENAVLMYLLEGDELYVFGKCSECEASGNISLPLIELLSQCPVTTVQ
jgi:hypothetical protein